MSFLRQEKRQPEAYKIDIRECDETDCGREVVGTTECHECKGDFCLAGGHLFYLTIDGHGNDKVVTAQSVRENHERRFEIVKGYYCASCLLAIIAKIKALEMETNMKNQAA